MEGIIENKKKDYNSYIDKDMQVKLAADLRFLEKYSPTDLCQIENRMFYRMHIFQKDSTVENG